MEEEVVPKRRRVTQACENCRALKSKCDGKRPVCSRCTGYGYVCRWKDKHTTRINPPPTKSTNSSEEIEALRDALQTSRQLLKQVRQKADPEVQDLIDSVSEDSPSSFRSPTSTHIRSDLNSDSSLRRRNQNSPRFLGEVSDVWFFNSVKGVLENNAAEARSGLLESYEREGIDSLETVEENNLRWPDREAADGYLEIYFSTIHLAYPHICSKQFMDQYNQFWDDPGAYDGASTFTSLLLTIFAIGSYYNVCTLSTEQTGIAAHSVYFRRAVACQRETDSSIDNIRCLLSQCFYLLATAQTDRCWLTLGLAIRLAQSIGLHVDSAPTKGGQISQEFRIRIFHSLYVLDRLLSLQLGRPPAIHDNTLRLPSRLDDRGFDYTNDLVPVEGSNEPQTCDYFIAVIKFSMVLGDVIRQLYRPGIMEYSEDMLSRTDRLDSELLDWQMQLPRWLRFDRGHTFERSPTLRRQRNMLAIKFHHLRQLIHRPYLALPWLQKNDSNIKSLLDSSAHRVVKSELICVKEAQETAHMLHDVTDKKTLVEDFPWWQMISCLICASSILLVMRAFTSSSTQEEKLRRETLEEDADTCLKVFEALSTNSDAARRAHHMLHNLRRVQVTDQLLKGTAVGGLGQDPPTTISNEVARPAQDVSSNMQPDTEMEPWGSWQDYWPSEMADSMAWSLLYADNHTVNPEVLSEPAYG